MLHSYSLKVLASDSFGTRSLCCRAASHLYSSLFLGRSFDQRGTSHALASRAANSSSNRLISRKKGLFKTETYLDRKIYPTRTRANNFSSKNESKDSWKNYSHCHWNWDNKGYWRVPFVTWFDSLPPSTFWLGLVYVFFSFCSFLDENLGL